MADVEDPNAGPTEPQSRNVVYCGGNMNRTPAILIFPSLMRKYSLFITTRAPLPDALAAATSTLSVDAQKRAAKDATKKAAKAEAAEAKHNETLASSKVRIKRVERNKRKYVTEVQGLEAFGLDLKKVAKEFGSKFATGSSVTKMASGGQEITVQGDVSDDVREFLLKTYKEIPKKNIVLEEPKKKKAEPAEV
ncbi:hypothetical protein DSL72_002309 [Monilinia vaccinii-corymbosi]|uniref:Translation machinery-associated protein 22 n=1 Tax=Monilinia vaccinii-corymbosi TaxID=61207 RepID=A0A8A3PC97_9HELO|nr:hypothetical protein DSL72_002309 [Monilinia vaccinii-corymbosi]